MTSRPLLLVAVALVAGIASGFFAGRSIRAPQTATQSNPTSTIPTKPDTSKASRANDTGLPTFDAAGFESRLRKVSSGPMRKRWDNLRDLAKSVAPGDEANALAIAEKILPRQEWWNFRYSLLEKWAEREPQAVLAYGQSLKSRNDRQQAISTALSAWARLDPDAALAWVEKQPRGQERQNFLSSALQGVAEADPKKAMEKLNNAPFYQQRWIRGQIINTLAESDPKAAAELALQHDRSSRYGGYMEGQLGNVLQKWLSQDADAAAAWFQAQPESVRKKRSVIQSLQNLAWQDPGAAMRLMEFIPPGQQREDTLGNVLNAWGNKDLDALRAWTDARTDPRENTLGQIACAQGLMASDPAAAAASLKNVRADERQRYAFQQVFNEYAQREPQAALAMAQSLSDSASRNQAISGALAGWAQLERRHWSGSKPFPTRPFSAIRFSRFSGT